MKTLGPARLLVGYPEIRPILLWAFVGRLPLGILLLAILFGVQRATGSLGFASLATALALVGGAAGTLLQGRLLDRLPKRKVIAAFSAVQAVSFVLLAVAVDRTESRGLMAAFALLEGLTIPSLSATTRLVLKRTVSGDDVGAAFALDATIVEVILIVGPLIATAAASRRGAAVELLLCGALVLVGSTFLLRAAKTSGLPPDEPRAADAAGPRRERAPRIALWLVGAVTLLGLPFGFIETGLTKLALERHSSVAPVGIAIAAMGVGSALGGIVYAGVRWRANLRVRFLTLVLGQAAVLALLIPRPSFGLVFGISLLGGLFIAPLVSLTFHILDRLSPEGAWMETQSWGSVANTAGGAAGLALGGAVATHSGSGTAFAAATLLGVASAIVSLPALRRLPEEPPAELGPAR